MPGLRRIPQKHGGVLVNAEKGYTANPHGRPPRLVADVINELKAEGYVQVKPNQVLEVYEAMLCIPEDKIIEIVNNKELPYFIRVIASAMTTKGKGFEIIERMIDRAHGRPLSKTDVTTGGNPFLDLIQRASGATNRGDNK